MMPRQGRFLWHRGPQLDLIPDKIKFKIGPWAFGSSKVNHLDPSPFSLFNEALPLTWEVKPHVENAETHKVHKDCILIRQIIGRDAADGLFRWWRIVVVF